MDDHVNDAASSAPRSMALGIAALLLGLIGFMTFTLSLQVHYPVQLSGWFRKVGAAMGLLGIVCAMVGIRGLKPGIRTILCLLGVTLFAVLLGRFMLRHVSTQTPLGSFVPQGLAVVYAVGMILCLVLPRHAGPAPKQYALIARVALVINVAVCILCYKESVTPRSVASWSPAAWNISTLAETMRLYAHDHHGSFPDPNRWCDLLIEQDYAHYESFCMPEIGVRLPLLVQTSLPWLGNWPPPGVHGLPFAPYSAFVWPPPREGRSDFAMNRDYRSVTQLRVVLLFQSHPGWNQSGGADIASVSSRHRRRGCLVAFVDGERRHVPLEDTGQLPWHQEQELHK